MFADQARDFYERLSETVVFTAWLLVFVIGCCIIYAYHPFARTLNETEKFWLPAEYTINNKFLGSVSEVIQYSPGTPKLEIKIEDFKKFKKADITVVKGGLDAFASRVVVFYSAENDGKTYWAKIEMMKDRADKASFEAPNTIRFTGDLYANRNACMLLWFVILLIFSGWINSGSFFSNLKRLEKFFRGLGKK